ncbi:hypothetical protein P152DRAFT_10982 [Eremomyces bilateralis CBS 781.70]|uniref:BZIP domain-containing protein n=1 Tax=Eremomyces bilateralis CBS 781.70 TaxID=1392243 RepID=A0A6G1GGK6_9PEZI|nr:uncharacterized protein P152DRAFT_10982 [Eremomyces bilateralis CBS 781.70]KAF1817198.1 hypothetical protein P152DRAFT_10982 [Eremomyces bilateralis CBS 781.70]
MNDDFNFDTGLADPFNWEDATVGAGFTAINNAPGSTSTQTVSPKDLFNVDPLASAPPSAAFTNLTSPSINGSPFVGDTYDTSPIFQDEGEMGAHNWFSLFPDSTDKPSAPLGEPMVRDMSNQSAANRSSSSASDSPVTLESRHRSVGSGSFSSLSGITKSRRRKGPLPPIEVDGGDKVALKRARNTLAARDSRQRKLEHVNYLESEKARLEQSVVDLTSENNSLRDRLNRAEARLSNSGAAFDGNVF